MVHVTRHAIIRYRERVRDVSINAAIAALDSPIVRKAADFGAKYVRLSRGQRIVLEGRTIVTVLPAGVRREKLRRQTHAPHHPE